MDPWIPCQDTSQEYIPHITISGVAHHVSGVSGYWVDITISGISWDLVVDTLRMPYQVYLVGGMSGYPYLDTPSEVVHLVGRYLDTMPGIPLRRTYLISPYLGLHTTDLEYLGIG